jgi:superfamily I DNA/RNA helicase
LSAVHRNIVVVGDDAQSIYAFRGANIENILNFEKDFPDVRVIKLEQNYRSTSNIVNAANSVIARNKSQLEKKHLPSNEEGSLIDVIKAGSDNEEGRLVATAIFEEKMQKALRNENFAILYRTNAQSRSLKKRSGSWELSTDHWRGSLFIKEKKSRTCWLICALQLTSGTKKHSNGSLTCQKEGLVMLP